MRVLTKEELRYMADNKLTYQPSMPYVVVGIILLGAIGIGFWIWSAFNA